MSSPFGSSPCGCLPCTRTCHSAQPGDAGKHASSFLRSRPLQRQVVRKYRWLLRTLMPCLPGECAPGLPHIPAAGAAPGGQAEERAGGGQVQVVAPLDARQLRSQRPPRWRARRPSTALASRRRARMLAGRAVGERDPRGATAGVRCNARAVLPTFLLGKLNQGIGLAPW